MSEYTQVLFNYMQVIVMTYHGENIFIVLNRSLFIFLSGWLNELGRWIKQLIQAYH